MLTSTQHILQIVRHIIMITLYIVAATFALWIYQHATKDNRIRSNTDKQIMEEIYRLLSPDYVPTSITIM